MHKIIGAVRLMALISACLFAGSMVRADGTSAWDQVSSKWECPEWFKDAKFGLWLHWGPQTVPEQGSGWYAREMYMEKNPEWWGKEDWGYHRKTYGHQSKFGYKDICNLWKAEKFDTEATIKRFQDWGARYVATMANHHDNFDLFPSSVHDWNSTKVGPKRDMVGEFAEAARRHNLKWVATVHTERSPKWFLPAFGSDSEGPLKGVPYDGNLTKADGKGLWWEGLDPQQLYASKYTNFNAELTQRIFELVTNYRPDQLYFDESKVPLQMYKACAALYADRFQKNGSIQTIVTVKSPRKGTMLDYEKGGAKELMDDYWQTDTTLASDWFFKMPKNGKGESIMRHSARSLKEMLVDIVSKRGCLLLNVAVRADGTVPGDQAAVLDELGAWLKGNGEAVYETRPWKVYGEGGAITGTHFSERGIASKPWDSTVLRFTANKAGTVLYVHVFGNPADQDVIAGSLAADKKLFTSKVKQVSVIGSADPVKWSMEADGLHVKMPGKLEFKDCNVVKIETVAETK